MLNDVSLRVVFKTVTFTCNGVVTLNCNKKKLKMANKKLIQGFYTL